MAPQSATHFKIKMRRSAKELEKSWVFREDYVRDQVKGYGSSIDVSLGPIEQLAKHYEHHTKAPTLLEWMKESYRLVDGTVPEGADWMVLAKMCVAQPDLWHLLGEKEKDELVYGRRWLDALV